MIKKPKRKLWVYESQDPETGEKLYVNVIARTSMAAYGKLAKWAVAKRPDLRWHLHSTERLRSVLIVQSTGPIPSQATDADHPVGEAKLAEIEQRLAALRGCARRAVVGDDEDVYFADDGARELLRVDLPAVIAELRRTRRCLAEDLGLNPDKEATDG